MRIIVDVRDDVFVYIYV